ncbi:MAG: hypothetical protein K2F99_09355, partial [Muribaculaceae bacterium]|nr:hypothetical protein [Muribaculaceae bacterium]
DYFKSYVYPTVLPFTVDRARKASIHDGLYILTVTRHGDDEDIGYIEIPKCMPRFIQVKDEHFVIMIEDLIVANIKSILINRKVIAAVPFAICRSAEVYIDTNHYRDPYSLIEETLKEREKSWITLVEFDGKALGKKDYLRHLLDIKTNTIVTSPGSMGIRLSDLVNIPKSVYKEKERQPEFIPYNTIPENTGIFRYIKQKDRLVFHPFESYTGSVVRFIEDAANDPDVTSIRISLYRVANRSRIVDALMKAADNGKLVVALIELKARFDEKHNMEISRIMQEGGIRIVYTQPDIKTHAKVCIVTRNESKGMKIYSHISTGNYSESNGKVYTDYSYFTADQEVGRDLVRFFNLLTANGENFKSKSIAYAPYNLKSTIVDEINKQVWRARKKKPAQITIN